MYAKVNAIRREDLILFKIILWFKRWRQLTQCPADLGNIIGNSGLPTFRYFTVSSQITAKFFKDRLDLLIERQYFRKTSM